MLDYKFLKRPGALNEAVANPDSPPTLGALRRSARATPADLLALVPESVARENLVFPLAFDGETLKLASADPDSIALTDKLRFILAKNVRLVPAPPDAILSAINRHYDQTETKSVDSMLAMLDDSDFDRTDENITYEAGPRRWLSGGMPEMARTPGRDVREFRKGIKGQEDDQDYDESRGVSLDTAPQPGGRGMFFYTVDEGQRVLMRNPDGTLEVIAGPKKVWAWRRSFTPLKHFVAHPGQFLVVRLRDGGVKHLPGPAEVWLDPREHLEVLRQDGLQLAAKEAVVVYSKADDSDRITRRIVSGPALFVPGPGEWLHTFSWHASKGGHLGVQKVPNALVFQKLWLMPDQMYHDVHDVRTADDAVLTVRLMIFFELIDIERMLDTTHDPIGDFVNAATSDVVGFIGLHDFESFKRNTGQLNEPETYRQLAGRAAQCGYRINKVVYRGYASAQALQQMHDEAIQARTRLQLDRATEQQAQDLENYKLDCQLGRASKRRTEQTSEVEHDLELTRRKHEAIIRNREAEGEFARQRLRQFEEVRLAIRRGQDGEQREHLAALREMGVDLTAYLTQARADRVIELRGNAGGAHVHLDPLEGTRDGARGDGHPAEGGA